MPLLLEQGFVRHTRNKNRDLRSDECQHNLEARDPEVIRQVLAAHTDPLLRTVDGPLLASVIQLVTQYDVAVHDQEIASWARDATRPLETRIESLRLLVSRRSEPVDEVLQSFLASDEPLLRASARTQLALLDPEAAIGTMRESFESELTSAGEWQSTLEVLASLETQAADQLIASALQWLIDPSHAALAVSRHFASVELDIVAAAEKRAGHGISELLETYQLQLQEADRSDALAQFRAALYGGSTARGERVPICPRSHRGPIVSICSSP